MRPTVIGAQPAAPAASPLPAPTVIGGGGVAPVAPTAPTAPAVSALPGAARVPLSVDLQALAERFPQAEPLVLQALQRELARHLPDTMDTLACERLGRDVQQQWATLLDRCLALMAHPTVRTGQRHLTHLRELLNGTLDQAEGRGWQWLRRGGAQKRLQQVLEEAQELKGLLQRAHEELLTVRQGLDQLHIEMADLHVQAMATVLAADVLATKVGAAAQPALLARGLSLSQTAQQIHHQSSTAELTVTDFKTLCHTLHDAVWVQWPGWQATMAAMPDGEWTATQRYLLRDQTERFLQQLG
ncbi:MAG: hypothetical protein RI907_2179 [Pseudomonadota bacterium]|jgi:hypothetical protein